MVVDVYTNGTECLVKETSTLSSHYHLVNWSMELYLANAVKKSENRTKGVIHLVQSDLCGEVADSNSIR